jgi:hypothetical protein
MTLRAPPPSKAELDRLKRSGSHLTNVQAPARTKEQVRQAAREFAMWRRQQIAEQTPVKPIYPTPERVSKEAHGMQSMTISQGRTAAPLKVHRTKPPVEQYAGQWGDYPERAFAMFIRDAETLDAVRLTVDFSSTGGGSAINRLGGLGSVDDSRRDALERYIWVRDRLPDRFQRVADWLLIEVRSEISGRTMGWTDVGRMLFPSIKDKATSRGISIGALLMTGELLASLYRKWAILARADEGEIEGPRFKVITDDRP